MMIKKLEVTHQFHKSYQQHTIAFLKMGKYGNKHTLNCQSTVQGVFM